MCDFVHQREGQEVRRLARTRADSRRGGLVATRSRAVFAGRKLCETCDSGVFGTPDIACADGLVCKYPNGGTAPSGPSGSSSASTGTCRKP
jgi:hypothetical protein